MRYKFRCATHVILTLLSGLGIGTACGQPGKVATNAAEPDITVFIARKIVTMDPGWPTGKAVAIKDGRILSVGTFDDLKPWLDKFTYRIDKTFEKKVLYPGFIEPHGHPIIGGISMTRPLLTYLPLPSPYGPAFPGVKTPEAAAQKLKEYVQAAASPDETILTWGYDIVAMGGKHLSKEYLDKISTTQPLLVWDASEHFVYANSAALKKYKVTRTDTKIPGVIAGADGEPNGQFLGTTATTRILVEPTLSLLRPEVAHKSMRFLMDLSRSNGITTTSELAFGAINLELEDLLFDRFFNDPGTPMRCAVVSNGAAMEAVKK